MANKKLTDLTELTTPADNDFLYIVDVSDTTESAQGTSKKIRKDKVDSGVSKENIVNKQNDLTPDGTGTKYPTVDAVNAGLPVNYSKIVYVNSTSPITATIFDTENPPVTNDNALKNDVANLYIGTDASTWVYNSTTYVTKSVTATSSNFYLAGTTTDAGNTKTGHITRSGAVTLTGSLNLAIAKISTTPNTSAGSYDILTRNSSTTALEKKLVSDFVQITGTQSISGRKNLNSDNTTAGGITIASSRTTNTGGTQDSAALAIQNTGTYAIVTETGSGDGILTKALGSGSAIVAQTFSTGAGLTLRNQGGTGDLLYAELGKVTISSAGKLSTTEAPTVGNNVTNKTYVDAKITQTITNGVTDKSPSEDAVFDAIDGVVKTIISDTPTSTNTGGVSEVLMHTYTIAGGKLPASCMPNLKIRIAKTGTAGTVTVKVRVNTVNDFATATNIGFFTSATSLRGAVFIRNFTLQGGQLTHTNAANSLINDEAIATNVNGVTTYDPSVTQYWFFSLQNSDAGDTTRIHSIKLVN